MATLLLRARYLTFGAVVIALVVLVALNKSVDYSQSLTSFFPNGDPSVAAYQRAAATFGNDNVVFITYDDPDLLSGPGMRRVAELAAAVTPQQIPAVVRVQSLDRMPLFWQFDDSLTLLARTPKFAREPVLAGLKASITKMSEGGSPFTIGGALQTARGRDLDRVRDRIVNHPLLRDTLVSATGKSTAIVVQLKAMEEQDPKATMAALRKAADGFAHRHGLTRPYLVGPPVLLADGFSAIERDGQRLAVVGLALIALVTFSATHSLWWSIVPVVAGWLVWRATETLLSVLHIKLALSGGPLVAQIIVLTMPAASHLAIHFRDELRRHSDREPAARHTLGVVATPVIWTAVTGAIGYAALLSSNVVPVFQFGAVLAGCTLVAALLTMAIAPVAMLPPFPLEVPVRAGSRSYLSDALNHLTEAVSRRPGLVVVLVLGATLPLCLGLFRLQFESNYINAFRPQARVAADYRETEERLGGIGVISLVVPAGPGLSMRELEAQQELGKSIAALTQNGRSAVSQVMSLATVLDPERKLAALPPEQGEQALQTKLDLIASAPQGELMHSFWSPRRPDVPDSGWARVVVRISERLPAPEKESIFRRCLSLAETQSDISSQDRRPYLTGLSYLLTQTTRGVMSTSWVTILWSLAGIFVMLSLAFRGPVLALLALLPSVLAVGFVLGLTSWMGVKLDLASALVASVALGLSVDDTFHCLLQYRRLRRTRPFRESLLASYHVSGPGVILSSLAVAAGFAVLRFSEFVPFANFGTMVGIATLGSTVGNLILLPACLAVGERWSSRVKQKSSHAAPLVESANPRSPAPGLSQE